MGNKTRWSEKDILDKHYHKNEDGTYSPIPLKSKFIQSLKADQGIKVEVKEVVRPSADFKVNSKYPITLEITPIGKPRMTQRDKWLKPPRKAIKLYWEYKDKLIAESGKKGFRMPDSNFHVTFILPMPNSWTIKKRNQMDKTPHQSKPDNDNMMKAFKDCLCDSDSHIWDYRITKLWGQSGKIIINEIK